MNTKILFVDDEPSVLAAYTRLLRKEFNMDTALGGEEGVQAVRMRGPYGVIVSDMNMPGMSGVEFLRQARQLAPDAVRMMLTGNNDQQTAMAAVNEGHIFRFLVKPCPANVFSDVLRAGLEQHRLITAEKELLEQTLRGSVKVLTEVLSLTNPAAFGRVVRLQRLVGKLAVPLKVDGVWRLEVAAMLSHIGCVTIPDAVLTKVFEGKHLADNELQMFEQHPSIGAALITQGALKGSGVFSENSTAFRSFAKKRLPTPFFWRCGPIPPRCRRECSRAPMWAAMGIWHRPKSASIFTTGGKGPACSNQRNDPRLKAVALALEKTPTVVTSVTIHGSRPWHWQRHAPKATAEQVCGHRAIIVPLTIAEYGGEGLLEQLLSDGCDTE